MRDNRGVLWNPELLNDQATVAHQLEANEWIFAKTMPKNPHWYTLRKSWQSDELFAQAVDKLRDWGSEEWWWNALYLYWDVNGYHYWTMGGALDDTILINRKPTFYPIRDEDKEEPADSNSIKSSRLVELSELAPKFLDIQPYHHVLEIGCRDGLFLEADIPCAEYFGIDRSYRAIAQATEKHPNRNFLKCSLEHTRYWKKFDRVVCLFGVPNSVPTLDLCRIPSMLTDQGKAILMWHHQSKGNFGDNEQNASIKHQFPTPDQFEDWRSDLYRSQLAKFGFESTFSNWQDKYLIEIMEKTTPN